MCAAHRADGHGRPAYEPSLMVALLLYGYARGIRSSRGIERVCVEDVAYRVGTGNVAPDRSTIAEFGRRHEQPLSQVFSRVLGLCARAGLTSVGVVAIDGTKIAANASLDANRDFGQIAREILAEAAETDRREDELCASERGDELPEHLRTREGRRRALREAEDRLERERNKAAEASAYDEAPVTVALDPRDCAAPSAAPVASRSGTLVASARHRPPQHRTRGPTPSASGRPPLTRRSNPPLTLKGDRNVAVHSRGLRSGNRGLQLP